jgi:hypothetical protein
MPKNSQIKKTSWWQSFLTAATRRLKDQPSHQDATGSLNHPAKLLCKCSEVSMGQFIACLCDDDLSQLVVSGTASPIELAEAWSSLFLEYCELAEDSETKYRVMLEVQLTVDKKKEELGQAWVNMLKKKHSENLAEALRIIGFDFELNPNDPEQYQADLKRINGELGFIRLSIQVRQAEFDAVKNKQSTKDTVDHKYFATIFFAINNYARREAVNKQTTVEDYCAALRAFTGSLNRGK